MKNIILLCALWLSACATVSSFDQGTANAYASHKVVLQETHQKLDAKILSQDEALSVFIQAGSTKQLIDAASTARRVGDQARAQNDLTLATKNLHLLQAYLDSAKGVPVPAQAAAPPVPAPLRATNADAQARPVPAPSEAPAHPIFMDSVIHGDGCVAMVGEGAIFEWNGKTYAHDPKDKGPTCIKLPR